MSHIHQGPLATYNSLTDNNLSGYFSNSRMRRHLRKSGLVSRQGEIVSESTYRLNMSRKEHKKQVKDMLAQAIVHKTLDLERARQAEIKKKLEEISKIQMVRRVRASTGRKGDEDVLPYLTPRGSQRPESSPAFKGRGEGHAGHSSPFKLRPNSAPGVRSQSRHSQISLEDDGDVLYLDDDGRPMTPTQIEQQDSQIDARHLHTLDTAAIRKYAMLMSQMEEGRGVTSPYMLSQVPLPPKAHLTKTMLSSRRVQSASPKRPVTTDSRIARLHRPETAKAHSGDMQTMCRVLMKYHGWALNLAREKVDPRQEVVVEQQHCGGNTLTVFKDRLVPGSTFEFISYRHRGYPFSLTLYLDGQMNSRVSTCCEYRHSRGARIGGRQGHFSLLSVDGAVPCYKCQVAKGVLVRNKATPRKAKRPSERHMEEVIVVATKKDNNDDNYNDDFEEEEEGTGRRVKPAKLVEEGGDRGVVIAVEKEEEEKDPKTPKSTDRADTTYDDDFDDDNKSSASSRSSSTSSSSSSESDTETAASSARKDEASKTKQKQASEEQFQTTEERGKESEGVPSLALGGGGEGEERRGGEVWRKRPAKVNGTGRQIDDYSSDDNDENQKKRQTVNMENVEAGTPVKKTQPSLSLTSSSSLSSSHSTAPTTTIVAADPDERGTTTNKDTTTVISVGNIDQQERDVEITHEENRQRQEAREKTEAEFLEQERAKREERRSEEKKALELKRQEELYERQMKEEAERKKKKEKMRRMEEEREKEETMRRMEEEREEEEKKRRMEEQRKEKMRENEEEEEKEKEEDDDEKQEGENKQTVSMVMEESNDIAGDSGSEPRPESFAEAETQESTQAQVHREPEMTLGGYVEKGDEKEDEEDEKEEDEEEDEETVSEDEKERENEEDEEEAKTTMRPLSPLPPPDSTTNLTVKESNLEDPEQLPSRAPSPFPPPAIYLTRRDTRTQGFSQDVPSPPPSPKELSSSPQPSPLPKSDPPPRATSPFPEAAEYMERPRTRRGREES